MYYREQVWPGRPSGLSENENGYQQVHRGTGWLGVLRPGGRSLHAVEPVGVDQQVRQFDQTIAPLLAGRCLGCHNASDKKGDLDLTSLSTAQTGGDSGPAIVAGKPLESYLWHASPPTRCPPRSRSTPPKKIPEKLDRRRGRMGHEPHRPPSFHDHCASRLRLVVARAGQNAPAP